MENSQQGYFQEITSLLSLSLRATKWPSFSGLIRGLLFLDILARILPCFLQHSLAYLTQIVDSETKFPHQILVLQYSTDLFPDAGISSGYWDGDVCLLPKGVAGRRLTVPSAQWAIVQQEALHFLNLFPTYS